MEDVFMNSKNMQFKHDNDPKLTVDPITLVEGLKLMHMHESYDEAN